MVHAGRSGGALSHGGRTWHRPGNEAPQGGLRRSAPPRLHRGGCATYPDQVGLISRAGAMVALAEPDIEPCGVCRPDTGLRG
ncbi:DUF6233 domain-containing protein [Streptomyces sp. QL37]|uniref:DUF6233 domain-containing protein n=1 Tax=Streptomyces sp. QL37 TaxID=2093747 RepID=UPI0021CB1D01|nr:DUF6233 domain-containing protein [Streptomyces sp. QL37]